MNTKSKAVIAGKTPIKTELEAGKKYYWCACGLSKKQPFCDGSHKSTSIVPRRSLLDQSIVLIKGGF